MIESKTIEDSRSIQYHAIVPADLNGGGRLFGGALLRWIDEIAGIVAKRHASSPNVTTVAIDNLQFKAGVYNADLLVIIGYITYVGNTSMEVRVDSYVENFEGMRHPINRAYFEMVAMGPDDKPTRVPRLTIENESQKAEWEGAELRKQNRLERRERGY